MIKTQEVRQVILSGGGLKTQRNYLYPQDNNNIMNYFFAGLMSHLNIRQNTYNFGICFYRYIFIQKRERRVQVSMLTKGNLKERMKTVAKKTKN